MSTEINFIIMRFEIDIPVMVLGTPKKNTSCSSIGELVLIVGS